MVMIVISMAMVAIFITLIVRQKHPLIKRFIRLKPTKIAHVDSGVFLLYNKTNKIKLAFIKNIGCRLYSGEGVIDLPFSNFTNYRIYPKHLCLYGEKGNLRIYANAVTFDYCAKFSYNFNKPNFAYRFDRDKQAIFLGDKYSFSLTFSGFKNLCLSPFGANELQITGEVIKGARIDFNKNFAVAKLCEVREFKRRNFGIIDSLSWDFVPKFSGKLTPLQRHNLSEKFSLSARKIELPISLTLPKIEAKVQFSCRSRAYIQITKLGFSKVVRIRQIGRAVTVVDLLSGVRYKFTADKDFVCRLVNFFGTNYLLISGGDDEITFNTIPICVENGKDKNYPLTLLCGLYSKSGSVDLNSTIRNLNLLILHGFWVDASVIISKLNYRFLTPYSQFLLANMLLSFINTFEDKSVLANSKLRNLVIRGLCYAMSIDTIEAGCFCEKILPLINSERAHQRVLLHKLRCKCVGKDSYEGILSVLLGIGLRGTELTIRPQRNISIETFVVIRGKNIKLKILPNWNKVRINNLSLGNIYTFDFTKLSSDTLLTFD